LSLPQRRNQIFLLAFHFPRLVLGRYLPFFSGFLLKRPPYLLEFAGERQGDQLTQMMRRAEERSRKLPSAEEVVGHTYVVAPRIRWQGMVENPLPSFWSVGLHRAWAGVGLREVIPQQQAKPPFRVIKNCGSMVFRFHRDTGLKWCRLLHRSGGKSRCIGQEGLNPAIGYWLWHI